MSDQHDKSFPARLVQRLAMPGALDRTPVQARYDRLQQGAGTHELSTRLHQRATSSGEAGGSSLVWRRSPEPVDAGGGGGVPVSAGTRVAAASRTPMASAGPPVVQRASLPVEESAAVTRRLMSRGQVPGALAAGSTISRPAATSSFSDAPAFAARLQSRYGLTSSETVPAMGRVPAAPAPSISRAPAGVIRRQVEAASSPASSSHDTARVVPASTPVSPGTGAAPMRARKLPAASAAAGILPSAGNGSATPDSSLADAPLVSAIPLMPAARPLLSAGSVAGAPLVLRRMLAAPAQSGTPLPTAIPPATIQLPREETPAPWQRKPELAVAMPVGGSTGSDIDRMAEEVGRRLMRRLEIERERKGIRQWR